MDWLFAPTRDIGLTEKSCYFILICSAEETMSDALGRGREERIGLEGEAKLRKVARSIQNLPACTSQNQL